MDGCICEQAHLAIRQSLNREHIRPESDSPRDFLTSPLAPPNHHCATTICRLLPSLPAILPQPELHGFGIEADQVAEFDRGESGLAHGAEGAFAATEVAAKVRGCPEAVLVGRLTGRGGGDDFVFRR